MVMAIIMVMETKVMVMVRGIGKPRQSDDGKAIAFWSAVRGIGIHGVRGPRFLRSKVHAEPIPATPQESSCR